MYTDRLHLALDVLADLLHYQLNNILILFLPFCLQASLCSQRGLLPNTDIQTFQVSLTNRVRLQYDRIREPISRVCACLCYVCYN